MKMYCADIIWLQYLNVHYVVGISGLCGTGDVTLGKVLGWMYTHLAISG